MVKLTCSMCRHELYSCTPELWQDELHKGCGGRYRHEETFNARIKKNGGIYYNDIFYPISGFTCNGCDIFENCLYAWDLYNIEGDCLAEK